MIQFAILLELSDYDLEIMEKAVKGFDLVPVTRGFERSYRTAKGLRAYPGLAKRINTWIETKFPGAAVRAAYEMTYGNITFYKKITK